MSEIAEAMLINEIMCALDEVGETLSETQEQILWGEINKFKISFKTD